MGMRCRLAVVLLATAGAAQAAGIHRCATPGGAVSYQEFPCGADASGGPTRLPTVFPEVDVAARERLLQREAALDSRLEAQRDRLSAEAIARMSRPEPASLPAEPAGVAWPAWGIVHPAVRWSQHPRPRNAMREWAHGRLR